MPELPARAFPSATVLGEPTPQELGVRCAPPGLRSLGVVCDPPSVAPLASYTGSRGMGSPCGFCDLKSQLHRARGSQPNAIECRGLFVGMTGTTHCVDRFDGPLAGHRLPAGPVAQGILVWPASGPLAACQAIPERRFLDADISCQMLRAGCHSERIHIHRRRSVAAATGQRPHECHSGSNWGSSSSNWGASSANWGASSANWGASSASRSVYHSESGSTTFKARPAAC